MLFENKKYEVYTVNKHRVALNETKESVKIDKNDINGKIKSQTERIMILKGIFSSKGPR